MFNPQGKPLGVHQVLKTNNVSTPRLILDLKVWLDTTNLPRYKIGPVRKTKIKAKKPKRPNIKKYKPNLKKTQNVEWFKGQILFQPFSNILH